MDIAGMPVSDEGKRLTQAVLEARAAGGEGRWIAARLSDGSTDGNIYDLKQQAIDHQVDETLCAYLQVPPAAMPPQEATRWIEMHRGMYAAGMRLQDPGGRTAEPLSVDQADLLNRQGAFLNRAARRQAARSN